MAGGEGFATLTIILYLLSSLFLGSLNQEDHYTVGSLRFVLICIHRVFLDLPCLILYTILWLWAFLVFSLLVIHPSAGNTPHLPTLGA